THSVEEGGGGGAARSGASSSTGDGGGGRPASASLHAAAGGSAGAGSAVASRGTWSKGVNGRSPKPSPPPGAVGAPGGSQVGTLGRIVPGSRLRQSRHRTGRS